MLEYAYIINYYFNLLTELDKFAFSFLKASLTFKCVTEHLFADFSYAIALDSKKISNDQELIQSDPISCPQNQKGNN